MRLTGAQYLKCNRLDAAFFLQHFINLIWFILHIYLAVKPVAHSGRDGTQRRSPPEREISQLLQEGVYCCDMYAMQESKQAR